MCRSLGREPAGDDHRRGGRLRHHQRGALLRRGGAVRRRRPRRSRRYLGHDHCVAVSEYTQGLHRRRGRRRSTRAGARRSAPQCRRPDRHLLSRPSTRRSSEPTADEVARRCWPAGASSATATCCSSRGSRPEKGVDDLIDGFARSAARDVVRLVIAGTGPALDDMRERARRSPVADRIPFLDDVDDAEKWSLMAGCAAFVLPSKPTAGVRRDVRHRAGREDAGRRRTGHHHRHRRHPRGGGRHGHDRSRCRRPTRSRPPSTTPCSTCPPRSDGPGPSRPGSHALQFDRQRVFDRLFDGLLPDAELLALICAGSIPSSDLRLLEPLTEGSA